MIGRRSHERGRTNGALLSVAGAGTGIDAGDPAAAAATASTATAAGAASAADRMRLCTGFVFSDQLLLT